MSGDIPIYLKVARVEVSRSEIVILKVLCYTVPHTRYVRTDSSKALGLRKKLITSSVFSEEDYKFWFRFCMNLSFCESNKSSHEGHFVFIMNDDLLNSFLHITSPTLTLDPLAEHIFIHLGTECPKPMKEK